MRRFVLLIFFCASSLFLFGQSNLNVGIAGIHRPVYEYFNNGYSLGGSPVLEYQFRWHGKRRYANRVGAELIYAHGISDSKRYSDDSISFHRTYAHIQKVFLQISHTKEFEFDKVDLYFGAMLQVPFVEKSNIRSYTFFSYGQIVGDYDWDYDRLWFKADSSPISWIHLKMGARYRFNERHSIAVDYMIGLNKRHILGLKYGFQFQKRKIEGS